MDIAVSVFSFILGGSFLGFLQFLISRKDSKNDRFDAIVKEDSCSFLSVVRILKTTDLMPL